MAAATALAIASTVAAVGSAGASIYGQRQAAKAQESAAKHNNKLAEAEARNLELESHEAISRQRRNDKRQLSSIRARLATNGALNTEGTPLAILGETKSNQELAIDDAARASSIRAASIRSAGQMGLWESKIASSAAKTANIGTAFSTLANLGSQAGNKAAKAKQPSAPKS